MQPVTSAGAAPAGRAFAATGRPIRLLAVDDHALTRAAIRRAVGGCSDIDLVGEADSGEQALQLAGTLAPGVVLLDLEMPGMGGLACTRRLRSDCPQARVVVFTAHDREGVRREARAAGAHAFLGKHAGGREILRTVRAAAEGEIADCAPPPPRRACVCGARRSPFDALLDLELAVVLELATGAGDAQIVARLGIGYAALLTCRHRIREKLHLHDDAAVVALARHWGIAGPA